MASVSIPQGESYYRVEYRTEGGAFLVMNRLSVTELQDKVAELVQNKATVLNIQHITVSVEVMNLNGMSFFNPETGRYERVVNKVVVDE